jgi:hypothetical protein
MRRKFLVLCGVFLILATCGTSHDDTVVIMDPNKGTTRTYEQVRADFAKAMADIGRQDCAAFADSVARQGVEFPAGRDLYVKACEEGQR